MELRDAQLRAVKWYIGDVEGDDPFWGDPKAYVTLNSLFFPGTATEEARAAEGKPLNPEILRDEERLCADHPQVGPRKDLSAARFCPNHERERTKNRRLCIELPQR